MCILCVYIYIYIYKCIYNIDILVLETLIRTLIQKMQKYENHSLNIMTGTKPYSGSRCFTVKANVPI